MKRSTLEYYRNYKVMHIEDLIPLDESTRWYTITRTGCYEQLLNKVITTEIANYNPKSRVALRIAKKIVKLFWQKVIHDIIYNQEKVYLQKKYAITLQMRKRILVKPSYIMQMFDYRRWYPFFSLHSLVLYHTGYFKVIMMKPMKDMVKDAISKGITWDLKKI